MLNKYSINVNNIQEFIKLHSDITTSYVEAIDLGEEIKVSRMAIYSTLNQDIKLKFESLEETPIRVMTVMSQTDYVFDVLSLKGKISIANLSGVALTTGKIQILFW
jgi:hypothetical protein